MVPSEESAAARARGNEFYKIGKLAEAEKAYKEAASLAPEDPLPLSNLSAVFFERGQYGEAATLVQRAVALSPAEGDEEKKQKMYARMAKCHLHTFNHQAAKEAAENISDQDVREPLLAAAAHMKTFRENQIDDKSHRSLVMDRLRRYKPYLTGAPEYFPTGHDVALSIFDEELAKTITPQDDVAFLFCGSGDARNALATISKIFMDEMMSSEKKCRSVHITLVDHSPAVVARNLIMFDMMFRFAMLKARKVPGCEDALTVMSYIYCCQIIPPFAHEKLQEHISGLIGQLKTAYYLVPNLYVATQSIPAVLRVLEQWQKGLGESYSVAHVRSHLNLPPESMAQQSSGFDRKSLRELRVLFPTTKFLRSREPALIDLIACFKESKGKQELSDYLDANWKLNTTLFDLDFQESRTWEGDRYAMLEFLPTEITACMQQVFGRSPKEKRAVDSFGQNLDMMALFMLRMSDRVQLECIVGEMTDVMERLRYDALEHRTKPPAGPEAHDPRPYPKVYDRIHMSNVPDYTGGHLTTFTHARPLLREDRASSLQFNNLLNPPVWGDHAGFQSEYLHMYDDNRIAQHFALRRSKNANVPEIRGPSPPSFLGIKWTPFMQEDYMTWERCPKMRLGYGKLLSRPAFEKWVYSLLLKFCVPYPRPLTSSAPVHAPLNLTQFLRLLAHLSEVGYPAHWLSGVLAATCSGTITTTTRPPKDIATTPKMLDEPYTKADLGIQPWKAELTTLASLWYPLLPFGLVAAPETLAPLSGISEYGVTFPSFATDNDNVPHFMVMFWNSETYQTPPKNLYSYLVTKASEEPKKSAKLSSIHCLTTFAYQSSTRTATFWLTDDFVEGLRNGKWMAYIARTDAWEVVTRGVEVSGGVTKLRTWLDNV
ncbi:hypothetical protein S40288_11307 [Stachybotrys chartarum IBT 40288]|nr:hypothetical protein S40288_11307 [Stachybotrys chartarum IBT 40288]